MGLHIEIQISVCWLINKLVSQDSLVEAVRGQGDNYNALLYPDRIDLNMVAVCGKMDTSMELYFNQYIRQESSPPDILKRHELGHLRLILTVKQT